VKLNQQNDPQAKDDERDQEMNIGKDGFRGSHQGHSFGSFQRCIKSVQNSRTVTTAQEAGNDTGTGSAFGIIPLA